MDIPKSVSTDIMGTFNDTHEVTCTPGHQTENNQTRFNITCEMPPTVSGAIHFGVWQGMKECQSMYRSNYIE